MTNQQELWRDVVGFERIYQVSSLGRVRRIGRSMGAKIGRVLKPGLDGGGYAFVTLYVHQEPYCKKVHRLVAEAFLSNPRNVSDVNHLDGVKMNNSLANLEWCTRSENHRHAYRTGIRKPQYGERGSRSKLTQEQVKHVCALYETGKYSWRQLAKRFGVAHTTIGNIIRGRTWPEVTP